MAKSNAHKQLMEFSEWEARQPGSYDIIVDGKIYNVTDIYEPVLPPNPDKLSLTEKQKLEVEELAEDLKGRPAD